MNIVIDITTMIFEIIIIIKSNIVSVDFVCFFVFLWNLPFIFVSFFKFNIFKQLLLYRVTILRLSDKWSADSDKHLPRARDGNISIHILICLLIRTQWVFFFFFFLSFDVNSAILNNGSIGKNFIFLKLRKYIFRRVHIFVHMCNLQGSNINIHKIYLPASEQYSYQSSLFSLICIYLSITCV